MLINQAEEMAFSPLRAQSSRVNALVFLCGHIRHGILVACDEGCGGDPRKSILK